MRFLAPIKLRLFLVSWILFSVHFATNVVREHYPAFALVDKGTFQVDEYADFHSDIFRYQDGHCYIGNQVLPSVFVAIPLLLFDPVLDALEAREKETLARRGAPVAAYETEYPNRAVFMRKAAERGLTLRFGAVTAITSLLIMAVLSAALVVNVFTVLRDRLVPEGRAAALALVFGFGTPVFYRTAHLNHNHFLMAVAFWAFLVLRRGGPAAALPAGRRFHSGLLAGTCVALDYAGAVILLALFAWWFLARRSAAGTGTAIRESWAFILGSVPPVLFLLWSQWAMYGDPFLPGQKAMPPVNFTDRGFVGFDWPAPDLFLKNLFSLDYGLFTFGPLLFFALWPAGRRNDGHNVLTRTERRFVAGFSLAFLVFCAANQYSRMQWNSGFRYLLPLVPFLFLLAAEQLKRLPRSLFIAVSVAAVAHGWVLSMARFTPLERDDTRTAVLESWRRVLTEGPQLPWLKVLARTSAEHGSWLGSPWLAAGVVALAAAAAATIWTCGARAAAAKAA